MINIKIDLSALLDLNKELQPKFNQAAADAAKDLALQSHAHLLEEVQNKLHSTREKYLAALKFEQVDDQTWVIVLDDSAMWIEEGVEPHSMVEDLLKSDKAKTAKDGSKYLSVPFQHNKGPTKQTQAEQDLTATIKAELKKRNIPYGKLEMDGSGKPKLGKLHGFDIVSKPTKTHEGPGQGRGPVGAVRQGHTGIPFLQRVSVYQKEVKDKATGQSKVVRNIMTFRTVSSKHAGTQKWYHPGLEPRRFFEETESWIMSQWDQKILPQILVRLEKTF